MDWLDLDECGSKEHALQCGIQRVYEPTDSAAQADVLEKFYAKHSTISTKS